MIRKNNKKTLDLIKEKYLKSIAPVLKQKRTQNYITLILTFFALSFFGVFAINPTITTIVSLQKQISDYQDTSEQLRQKLANMESLQKQYTAMTPNLPLIQQALPNNALIAYFIGQLQAVATQQQVGLNSIQTGTVNVPPIKKGQPYAPLNFSVEAEGTYDHVTALISALRNFNRLVTIDTVSITREQRNDQLFLVDFTGKVYFKIQ